MRHLSPASRFAALTTLIPDPVPGHTSTAIRASHERQLPSVRRAAAGPERHPLERAAGPAAGRVPGVRAASAGAAVRRPFPPPKKSNKGLVIGLVAGAVVLMLAICGAGIGLVLVNGDDDEPDHARRRVHSPDAGTGSTPGTEPPPRRGSRRRRANNNAVTARYSSDLSNVCDGGQILNAATYSGPAGAKAYMFSNNPDRPTSWSSKSVASDKPYYAKSADFQTVSVVGCLKFVEGSEGAPKKCQYKDSAGKQVTVYYISSRYTLTFYAAKTGREDRRRRHRQRPGDTVPELHLVQQDHHEGVRGAGLRHHRGRPGQVPVLNGSTPTGGRTVTPSARRVGGVTTGRDRLTDGCPSTSAARGGPARGRRRWWSRAWACSAWWRSSSQGVSRRHAAALTGGPAERPTAVRGYRSSRLGSVSPGRCDPGGRRHGVWHHRP